MKRLLLPLMALSLAITSCSRDNDDITNPIENPVAQTPLLPMEISGGKYFSLKYTYADDNKLATATKISKSSGQETITNFTYKGDLIKSFNNLEFTYDNQQRLIKTTNKTTGEVLATFTYSGNKINYEYITSDPSGFSEEIELTVENGQIVKGEGISYEMTLDNPNFPRTKDAYPDKITIMVEYDDKKNIFGDIKGIDKLHPYLIVKHRSIHNLIGGGSKNNITKYRRTYLEHDFFDIGVNGGASPDPYDFYYTYGENGYPTSYILELNFNDFSGLGIHPQGTFNVKYNR